MKSERVEVIKLKVAFSHGDGTLVCREVECHFWTWTGCEGEGIDCYVVRKGRLVKAYGYNNVSEVVEV
jgi:hypothetical protein